MTSKRTTIRKRSLFVAAAAVAIVSSPSTAFSTGGGTGSHHSRNSAINVPHHHHHPTVTTSSSAGGSTPALTALHATHDNDGQTFDQRAFELKNMSRKKFGLKPMTEQEFVDLQIQVQAMEAEQALKAEEMRQSRAASAASEQNRSSPAAGRQQQQQDNIFATMAKSLLGESTCESNYDCARPQVCCDLGFKKMCCSSGKGIFEFQAKMEMIPVPAVVRNEN